VPACVCVWGGGSNADIVPLFVHRNLWPFTEGGGSAVSGDAIRGCDSLCVRDQSVQNKYGVTSL
jgi:hypothetical protein